MRGGGWEGLRQHALYTHAYAPARLRPLRTKFGSFITGSRQDHPPPLPPLSKRWQLTIWPELSAASTSLLGNSRTRLDLLAEAVDDDDCAAGPSAIPSSCLGSRLKSSPSPTASSKHFSTSFALADNVNCPVLPVTGTQVVGTPLWWNTPTSTMAWR